MKDAQARGLENVPAEGPLIIAANHPGAADSAAIGANAGRDDLKILASDVPFLKNLSQIGQRLIFLPRKGIQARMLAMREAIRAVLAKSGLRADAVRAILDRL